MAQTKQSGPDPSGEPLENKPPEEKERVGEEEIGLRDRGEGEGRRGRNQTEG